jgi:hypothetical protein
MNPGDRMTKGLDFMLKGIAPKDKIPEAVGKPTESGVTTQESGKITQEPKVTRDESDIQESGVVTRESGFLTPDSADQPHETKPRSRGEKKTSRNGTQESGVVTDDTIDQAVAQAMKSPKISLYSPLLLAVLESQQLMLLNRKEMTLLQYRKATKARELVENALMEAYPELCEKILKRMNEENRKS